MNILSEKPIADTLAASVRIAEKVRKAGVKMGVTMSHRFRQDITTLRSLIQSGDYGPLDYLVCRFTCDCRKYGTWGAFRYEIPDALLVEGAVHHLDLLADMAGPKCDTIYAQTWNPDWSEFAGDAQALVMMNMSNGTRAFYEGAKTNAIGLNGWGDEYIRAECRDGTLIMSHQGIERFVYNPGAGGANEREGTGENVPLIEQPKWANAWLIEKFVGWLDGGEPMETNVEDNLQSVALIFAAVESSRTGKPIKVQDFLDAARYGV
jgi:predicted dehydrogenase